MPKRYELNGRIYEFDDSISESEAIQVIDEEDKAAEASKPGYFGRIADTAKASFMQTTQGLAALASYGGADFADTIAEYERNMPKASAEMSKFERSDGFVASVKELFNDPETLPSLIISSATGSYPALAGGAAGALAANPLTVAAGVGAGSLAVEAGTTFLDVFRESGVDLRDPEKVRTAFKDEVLMSKAMAKGIARGIPVAALDALSAKFAGSLVKPALKKGAGIVGAGIAEMAVQSAAGGAGEALGSLAAGDKISPSAVVAEMFASVASDGAEIALGTAARRGDVSTEARKAEMPQTANAVDLANKALGVDDVVPGPITGVKEALSANAETGGSGESGAVREGATISAEQSAIPGSKPGETTAVQEAAQPQEGGSNEAQDEVQGQEEDVLDIGTGVRLDFTPDASFATLTDEELRAESAKVRKAEYDLETEWDNNPNLGDDPEFMKRLRDAQAASSSASFEARRRDDSTTDSRDLMQELKDNLKPDAPYRNDAYWRSISILREIQKRGEFRFSMSELSIDSADKAEVTEGFFKDLQTFISKAIENGDLQPADSAAPSEAQSEPLLLDAGEAPKAKAKTPSKPKPVTIRRPIESRDNTKTSKGQFAYQYVVTGNEATEEWASGQVDRFGGDLAEASRQLRTATMTEAQRNHISAEIIDRASRRLGANPSDLEAADILRSVGVRNMVAGTEQGQGLQSRVATNARIEPFAHMIAYLTGIQERAFKAVPKEVKSNLASMTEEARKAWNDATDEALQFVSEEDRDTFNRNGRSCE